MVQGQPASALAPTSLRSRRRAWSPVSFLGRLTPGTCAALLQLGVRRHYRAGQTLMREGEATTHAVLLRKGYVKVTATTEEGGSTLLAVRPPGDLVGELAAISGAPRSATVTAAVEVAGSEISRPEFLAFLRRYPDAALALTTMEGDRLRMANRRRLDISGYGTKARIARLLIELGESFGRDTPQGRVIGLTLPQRELAELIGVAHVTVQRALRTLRASGLIDVSYRRITIVRPEALDEVARRS